MEIIQNNNSIQFDLASEIQNLEEQRKTYRIYHIEKLSVLENDKNRLMEVKWIRETGNKPSRGKYLNLSIEELEVEIIAKTLEINKTKKILKSKKLKDNTVNYDNLMIALRKVSRKRF